MTDDYLVRYIDDVTEVALSNDINTAFRDILTPYNIENYSNVLLYHIIRCSNILSIGEYHYIFKTVKENGDLMSDNELADKIMKCVLQLMTKSNMSYLALFINEQGSLANIEFVRKLVKGQTGFDRNEGNSSTNLMNENVPINNEITIVNPSSKSASNTETSNIVNYNNNTEYDNKSSVEEVSYYRSLKDLNNFIFNELLYPLIQEYMVNNW